MSGSDGLARETWVKCDILYRRRCVVTPPRRHAIVQRIHAGMGFTFV